MDRLKVAKEELELKTALAESSAKLKVLKEYEKSEDGSKCCTSAKGLHGENRKQEGTIFSLQPDIANFHTQPQSVVQHDLNCNAQNNRGDEILKVLQNQNIITELLVKQQKQSQLPMKGFPVFKGNARQYKSFIRVFEHSMSNEQ